MLWAFQDLVSHATFLEPLAIISLAQVVQAHLLSERKTTPAPLSILPSQEFDGNDGPWSTFTVQIGNPPQKAKVLISTYATQIWAIAEEGCTSGDLTDCNDLRGGLFNHTASTSWNPNLANLSTQIYGLGIESNLGFTGNGRYGFDDVTLGFQGSGGPNLKNQTVASVATKDFFLGIFGLKPMPSNFTDFDNPIPSFMENLKTESMIPSTSWAYTAGNQYRSNEVLGSLTLGGYDASRFVANNVTFPFSTNDQPDLAVQISSITAVNTTSGSTDPVELLSPPITTYLDSTIPYLYLPLSACNLIESTFGLTYNTTTSLYTISSTRHTILLAQSPSLTFTVTRPDGLSSPITIVFPYRSFALKATWPLASTPILYFPIKRASDSSQYRLGRAFFQEAYVIADYEQRNFSVSQVTYDNSTSDIIAILPTSSRLSFVNPVHTKSKLSTSTIAGIAIGASILVILISLTIYYFLRLRPKRLSEASKSSSSSCTLSSNSNSTYPNDPDGYNNTLFSKAELDTTAPTPLHELSSLPPTPREADSTPATKGTPRHVIFELPAVEEVAAEVPGSANLSSTLLDEQNEMYRRREAQSGSGTAPPKEKKRRPKTQWSWDRRRRASLGESSTGLGTESSMETVTTTTATTTTANMNADVVTVQVYEKGDIGGRDVDTDGQTVFGTDVGSDSISSGWVSEASPRSIFVAPLVLKTNDEGHDVTLQERRPGAGDLRLDADRMGVQADEMIVSPLSPMSGRTLAAGDDDRIRSRFQEVLGTESEPWTARVNNSQRQ